MLYLLLSKQQQQQKFVYILTEVLKKLTNCFSSTLIFCDKSLTLSDLISSSPKFWSFFYNSYDRSINHLWRQEYEPEAFVFI